MKLLRNETLNVVGLLEDPWFKYNATAEGQCGDWCVVDRARPHSKTAGAAGGQLSGIEVSLMQRIAALGEFRVAYHYEPLPVGWSWTDALVGRNGSSGLIDRYDLIAGGGWVDTAARRALGVQFTSPLNDQSIMLAIKKNFKGDISWTDTGVYDYWIKPFTADGWACILVFVWMLPAVLALVLENSQSDDFRGTPWYIVARTILRKSALNVFGFGDFEWPTQFATRVIFVFYAALVLILLTTYTSNMTAHLVVASAPQYDVKDINEFIMRGRTACLPDGWGSNAPVLTKWPDLRFVYVDAEDVMKEVYEGRLCQGTLFMRDYLKLMLAGGPPCIKASDRPGSACEGWGCKLTFIGPTEIPLSGAFPAGSDRVNDTTCRWLPLQVVNAIITHLSEANALREVFHKAERAAGLGDNGQHICPSVDVVGSKALRLSWEYLGGLIVWLCGMMCVAFVAGVVVIRKNAWDEERQHQRVQQEYEQMLVYAKKKFDILDKGKTGQLDQMESLVGVVEFLKETTDKVQRERTEKRIDGSDGTAKGKHAFLTQHGDLKGEELWKKATPVEAKLGKREARIAEMSKESLFDEVERQLELKLEDGVVTWDEFEEVVVGMHEGADPVFDDMLGMHSKDPSSNASTGEMVMLTDVMMMLLKEFRSMKREVQKIKAAVVKSDDRVSEPGAAELRRVDTWFQSKFGGAEKDNSHSVSSAGANSRCASLIAASDPGTKSRTPRNPKTPSGQKNPMRSRASARSDARLANADAQAASGCKEEFSELSEVMTVPHAVPELGAPPGVKYEIPEPDPPGSERTAT